MIKLRASATTEYRPQLDGLRFLAFLGVFAFHANKTRYAAGSLGVPLFFVLSGFLITRILLKNQGFSLADDLRVFYIRRILRIFPLYYATLIVLSLAGKTDGQIWSWLYLYNFACYFKGSFIGDAGHFWTLAVEEQFYMLYPIALLATPARLRPGLLWAGLCGCVASRLLLDRLAPNPMTGMLPNVAGEALIAGAIAGYWDWRRPGIAASSTRFLLSCGIVGWGAMWVGGVRVGPSWLGAILPEAIALGMTLLVWEIWRTQGLLGRALSLRPLVYLGKISYGLYVFHLFAIQNSGWVLARLEALGLPGLRAMKSLPAFGVTVAMAIVSWHLFEAPILSLKSRFGYGVRREPAVASGVPPRPRRGLFGRRPAQAEGYAVVAEASPAS